MRSDTTSRIEHHPLLHFPRGSSFTFIFDGKPVTAHEGESIAAALHAAGIRQLSRSVTGRPRGLFCAIGKCSSCLMTVNGVPNVRSCITPAKPGMEARSQAGHGELGSRLGLESQGATERSEKVVVIGAGPAGLSAAITLHDFGIQPLLLDENPTSGGQLVKQTHKFFGSQEEKAGHRGVRIGMELTSNATGRGIQILQETTVFGIYRNGDKWAVAAVRDNGLLEIGAEALVIATGASERMIAFPGCDLPGVLGAGGVQTLMNIYGIRPGRRVLMVGAGNVGLIVAYQLLQAGAEVSAVVEAAPRVGGYHVHAAKLARCGVPILTSHTILRAFGDGKVEGATIGRIAKNGEAIEGEEQDLDVDTISLAVGLTPSIRLLQQIGCRTSYVGELGGEVPVQSEDLQTSIAGIHIAGDDTGIGEASVAMIEGRIAALSAAAFLGTMQVDRARNQAKQRLCELRQGPFGERALLAKKRLWDVFKKVGNEGR